MILRMNVLILYGTIEGQTEKIVNRMADLIRNRGHHVVSQPGAEIPAEFLAGKFDGVIIGGSIHMGKYPKYLRTFITENADWINTVPSAFFTVCMAINSKHEKSRKDAIRYSELFLSQAGCHPRLVATFAGAVKYTKYNIVTRFIMKLISKREGGSTDTSVDHEYTDWESVVRFTNTFLAELAENKALEKA